MPKHTTYLRRILFCLALFFIVLFTLGPASELEIDFDSDDDSDAPRRTSALRRDLIEADTRKGATWNHIYVVNLAHRADRRAHMSAISDALDLEFTFVQAFSKENPVVPWILEQLLEDQIRASTLPGGLLELQEERRWGDGRNLTWRQQALLSLTSDPPNYPPPSELLASSPRLFYPPKHKDSHGGTSIQPAGQTACLLSHLSVLELAIRNGDETLLVLEDDIDVEFGLVERWKSIGRALEGREEGWDMVYLGFIWSDERRFKPTFHPLLRPSVHPAGLHAYSLSRRGAIRLHHLLTTSPSLFDSPLDHKIPREIIASTWNDHVSTSKAEFKSWTVVPPLVIPGSVGGGLGSDIEGKGGGGGLSWGGILGDSTVKRIKNLRGIPSRELSDEEVASMPAVQFL